MEEFPFQSGIVSIIIGFIMLYYQLKKNNSFKMSEYGVNSWRVLVNIWALIIMSFIVGITLIFKN